MADARPLVIALTGGIGSGKSTVADRFAEHGVPVIDADLLAREQTRPGMPALDEITKAFGAGMIAPDGELDRAALRRQIFELADGRERLEAILHPRIRQAMREQLASLQSPYVVLVIPLLLETGQTDLADRILVVDLPEAIQLRRAAARDGQNERQIRAIMEVQCDRQQRLSAADDVIDNSADLDQLLDQADKMHERYMSLSRNK